MPSGLERFNPRLIGARAIVDNVRDGDTICVGGFGQNIPFAACHEILRQKRRKLTLCRTGADIVFDQMIAAVAAVAALAPDLAIVHAQRGDASDNHAD